MRCRDGIRDRNGNVKMEAIRYIDCYAQIGKYGQKDEVARWSRGHLLEEMHYCGIHGALVTHGLSRFYDPAFGNRMLASETAGCDRLYQCWTVLPADCGELPEGEALVAEMRGCGVRAAKVFPQQHRYIFDVETFSRTFPALQDAAIPLLVELKEAESGILTRIREIARSFPGLGIVLQGPNWSDVRMLFSLMSLCSNIFIEFSSNQANRAIEDFSAAFGPERLLFGTNFPFMSPGAAKAFVDYAQISDEDRALVAGGNLARLLGLDRMPPSYDDEESPDDSLIDPILAAARSGRPLVDIEVIDAHTHMVHDGGAGVGTLPMPHGDVHSMLERNRLLGIDLFCSSAWLGIYADAELGNTIIARARQAYPGVIEGYATIDPNYSEDFQADILKWHEHYGFKGVKPYYPGVGIPYRSPRYSPWFSYANQHRLFVLLHQDTANYLSEVEELASTYADASFLLAHSGGSFQIARERSELANRFANVFLEITLTPVPLGVIELLVAKAGPEKVIFGTDAPMRDPIPQFGWVAYAHISHEHKKMIFGGNMRKILDRCEV